MPGATRRRLVDMARELRLDSMPTTQDKKCVLYRVAGDHIIYKMTRDQRDGEVLEVALAERANERAAAGHDPSAGKMRC